MRLWGALAGVAPMFVAGVLIGYFGGVYLDDRLGTDPWLTLVGMLIGSGAGFAELARVVRRAERLERRRREERRRGREGAGKAEGRRPG